MFINKEKKTCWQTSQQGCKFKTISFLRQMSFGNKSGRIKQGHAASQHEGRSEEVVYLYYALDDVAVGIAFEAGGGDESQDY